MSNRLPFQFYAGLFAAITGLCPTMSGETFSSPIEPTSLKFDRPEFVGYNDSYYNPGLHPASEWRQIIHELHPYNARTFSVSVTGLYTLNTTKAVVTVDVPDTYVNLYDGNFDPASPLSHGIVLNDDISNSDPRYAELTDILLTAGTKYTLVTTFFIPEQTGVVTYELSGPGTFDLAPAVLSINRQSPSLSLTNASTLLFRVSFSEPVSAVSTDAFQLTSMGSAVGTIASVAAVDGSTFDVTVTNVSGDGNLRLDLKNGGAFIVDSSGQSPGEFISGQNYAVLQVPVITSATAANAVLDTSFSYNIVASHSPTSYSASGLPTGLSIDSTTGAITGSPTQIGVFTATINATNGVGTGTASLVLTVTVPPRMFIGKVFDAGNVEAGAIAFILPANSNAGTLVVGSTALRLGESTAFQVETNDTIAVTLNPGTTPSTTLALAGTATSTTITGSLGTTGYTFSASLEPDAGTSATISGLYRLNALNTDQGAAFLAVGTNGNIVVVSSEASGNTAIATGNSFTGNGDVSPGTFLGSVSRPAANLTVSLSGRQITYAGLLDGTPRTDRLVNLSSRGNVQSGSRIIVAGFVVDGASPKQMLVRAIGPRLADFNVTGALVDPQLTIYKNSTIVAQNDNWGFASNASDIPAVTARLGGFALTAGSKDAVLLVTLAPGAYTAQITSTSGAGVGLVEIYDASTTPGVDSQRLVNVSGRGVTSPGEGVLTAGFVISGNTPKRVLVRGVGPALLGFNVSDAVTDSTLTVSSGSTIVAQNDDWDADATNGASVSAAVQATGAFPFAAGSKDAAIVLTLAPGTYTVQVAGKGSVTTGVALAEVFEIPE